MSAIETPKKFQPSILAFLDALGFKKKSGILEEVLKFKSDVDANLNVYGGRLEKFLISDSIVLVAPLDVADSNLADKFEKFVHTVGVIQRNMLISGTPLRGALTIGDVVYESAENWISGPALTQAVVIEGSFAKAPRIVVDTKSIDRGLRQSLEEKRLLVQPGGIFSDDPLQDVYYVNFLRCNVSFNNAAMVSNMLDQVKLAIEQVSLLYDASGVEHAEKYEWLRRYILQFCNFLETEEFNGNEQQRLRASELWQMAAKAL